MISRVGHTRSRGACTRRATASRIPRRAEQIDWTTPTEAAQHAVDVNGIIQEMLTLLKGEADRSSVAMRTELSAELPKIMADRVQLQQVFMNLMLNAIEAMKNAGGDLTVKSQADVDGQLLFSVSDTGMGLAISRSIIESHGGRVWATANDGHGATFHFTLPTAAPLHEQEPEESLPEIPD